MKRLVLIAGVTLVAMACSSGSGTATSTTSPDTVEVDTTAADAGAGGGDDSGAASCVGVWELDNEAFFAEYATIAGPGEAIEFVSGAYLVTWNGDGTFTDERVDWTMAFPEVPDSGAMVMNSTGAGNWEGDPASAVSSGYSLTDARIQIVVEGEVVDLPVDPASLPAGVFPERGSVTCTDTTMTISAGGFNSILHRQP